MTTVLPETTSATVTTVVTSRSGCVRSISCHPSVLSSQYSLSPSLSPSTDTTFVVKADTAGSARSGNLENRRGQLVVTCRQRNSVRCGKPSQSLGMSLPVVKGALFSFFFLLLSPADSSSTRPPLLLHFLLVRSLAGRHGGGFSPSFHFYSPFFAFLSCFVSSFPLSLPLPLPLFPA
jgi:hypothetical protein